MKQFICIAGFCLFAATIVSAQNNLKGNGIDLSWETKDDKLIVTLTAPTTGWIAFGTDATSMMKNADIIIVWVDDATGIAMGEDHFGTGATSHKQDTELGGSQDLLVLSGEQTQNRTTVTFSIPLNSGDRYDTLLEHGRSYPLILASGKSDDPRKKHNRVFKGEIPIP